MGFSSAVECNADLSQGGDSCTVSSSLTLNGSYVVNMNGTGAGALIISAGSVTLDCNGTSLIGNNTNGLFGIVMDGSYNSVVVKNCNLFNYSTGIKMKTGDYAVVQNNTITNSNVSIFYQTGSNDGQIINNRIIDTFRQGVSISNSQRENVSGNYFNNSGRLTLEDTMLNNGLLFLDSSAGSENINNNFFYSCKSNYIMLYGNSQSNITNNYLEGIDAKINLGTYQGIYVRGNNHNIFMNNFTHFQYPIFIPTATINTSITFNNIYNNDIGSRLSGVNTNFSYNILMNNTLAYDSYCLGIKVINAINPIISYNNITEITKTGILFQNVTGGFHYNNFYSFVSLNNLFNYNICGSNEIPSAIRMTPLYSTYIGESIEPASLSLTTLQQYKTFNLTSYGNTFDSNVPVYYYTSGGSGLNITDIPSSWYRSFNTVLLENRNQVYINNLFDNITTSSGSVFSNTLISGYRYYSSGGIPFFNYTVFKSYSYFININSSTSEQRSLYNLTSALLTNGSSICNGSSSNLALNTGNLNITLQPNEACWVMDNFTLVDILDSRENAPFTYSLSGNTLDIVSNLDTTIYNISGTFYLNYYPDPRVKCENIKSTSGLVSYTCNQATQQLTMTANLNPGHNQISFTLFQLDQGICGSALSDMQNYPLLIGLIGTIFLIGIVILFVGGYMLFKSGAEITNTQVGIFFITLMAIAILVIIGIVAIQTICSVGVVS
jgi:hypothetical protein